MKKPNQMRVIHPENNAYAPNPATMEIIRQERFHQTHFLPGLLTPFYRFRMHVKFFTGQQSKNGNEITRASWIYGFENKCTYLQCLRGYVQTIVLDRIYGYNSLLKMIEAGGQFFNKISSASIYGRDESGQFAILHRHYDGARLDEARVNDPEIDTADQYKQLHFTVVKNRLVIIDPDQVPEAPF